MANWNELSTAINAVIKTNGKQEITGAILQNVLNTMVGSLGANPTFAGIASTSTAPGTPDGNVYWIASNPGTYANFGGYVHDGKHVVFFVNTASGWSAIDTGIKSEVNTFIFSSDTYGLSAYIEDIVFELNNNVADTVIYKPNGDLRKFALQNIDPTSGRVVMYREGDNGVLAIWYNNVIKDWLTTKNIVFTTQNVTVRIFLKQMPTAPLYPLQTANVINRNVIRRALINRSVANNTASITEIQSVVFGETELLPRDSKFDANSNVTAKNVGLWQIRYALNAKNFVEKTTNGIKVVLDAAGGINPALWIINYFNSMAGKTVKISGSLRGDVAGSVILYTNGTDFSVTTLNYGTDWTPFEFTTTIGTRNGDFRVMFYKQTTVTFYAKDVSIIGATNQIEFLQDRINEIENSVADIKNEIMSSGIELLPENSLLDANTPLTVSDGVNIGAGDIWQLRYPGVTTNVLSKIGDYFAMTLDSTENENAAFWARNVLTAYVGATVKIKFSMKRNGGTSAAVRLIIGGTADTKLIAPTKDWTEYEYDMVVLSQYPDNRIMFYSERGTISNICLRNISVIYYTVFGKTLDKFNQRITTLENHNEHTNNVFTENIPNIMAKIGENIFESKGVMNIGMFGDSWTQGVGSVSTGLITYVKYIARMMWEKYGFAGHGWFDFGYSNSTDMKCADDEAITLTKSGKFDYLSKTANCLGINIAHTVFSSGASYTLQLTDHTKPIDKGVIWFYENAAFTVAVNDEIAEAVTGVTGGGWQSKEITGDITKIAITATANGSIIFGIDLSYGTKGVKVHKLGNRGLTTTQPLQVDIANWQTGLSKLSLDFFSCLLFTNDRSSGINPTVVTNNIAQIIDNVNGIYPLIDKAIFTPSETLGGAGSYTIAEYTTPLRNFCIEKQLPFLTFAPIFGNRAQIKELRTFVDSVHPSKTGDYLIAEYIFKHLFEYYQYK